MVSTGTVDGSELPVENLKYVLSYLYNNPLRFLAMYTSKVIQKYLQLSYGLTQMN